MYPLDQKKMILNYLVEVERNTLIKHWLEATKDQITTIHYADLNQMLMYLDLMSGYRKRFFFQENRENVRTLCAFQLSIKQ